MIPNLEGIPTTPDDLRRTIEDIIRDVNARRDVPRKAAIIKAATYERQSRLVVGEESYSLEIQADRAADYVHAQGWSLVETYSDPNFSGKNGKRPNFRRCITDIKSRRFNVLAVHRLDRLYRNVESLLKFLRFLRRYDVRLVSVTEQIDTNTYWGMLIVQVMGSIAEMYVRYASEHTRAAKHERVSRGLPNGGARFGYCNGRCSRCVDPNGLDYCPLAGQADRGDGRVLIPHPIESHAVRLIHELYHRGWSYADVAAYLNDNDFNLEEIA